MASIKKKSSGGGGANWMDTYGDMVTLLLCFFVLLYSMSSIDANKWEWIVQQFNKDYTPPDISIVGPQGSQDKSGGNAEPTTSEVEQQLTELYNFIQSFAESNPESSISVSKGDGYVFISFNDTVFFDGNSFDIRPEGKLILDSIIPALEQCGPAIDELKVIGHTAQQSANEPNPVGPDRRLASNRATEVVIYLQERLNSLDPGRLVAEGDGQWRPVSSNATAESRARNRRVEMVVTGEQTVDEALGGNYEQYFTMYQSATGQSVGASD